MTEESLRRARDTYNSMRQTQQQWVPMWTQLNEAFYPFLYGGLLGGVANTHAGGQFRNTKLLDGEPAKALLTLAAGFMNGVTSPARKWVNVKKPGSEPYEEPDDASALVYSDIRQRLLEILAGSNYYDSRAVQVYDGAGLGTGALLCYEDRNTVVKFTVCPPGSYCLETNAENEVVRFGREFKLTAAELVEEFGADKISSTVRERAEMGGAQARTEYIVHHLIEERPKGDKGSTPFRERYWLASRQSASEPFLAERPLYEWPAAVLRWACPDNCVYGIPPTLTVLGKAVQLQNLEYKSDQGLDKLISPPLLAHVQLRNRPKAFSANGITFTSDPGLNAGARPLYQLQVPFQELEIKRQRIVEAIREGLFNHLFDMISQLDTVRSATEIDARQEEKLVMLGPVLHRSYLEDIGVVIKRVFGIATRKGLMPRIPDDMGAEIEFRNVLSDVQKASDVATLERFTEYVGRVIPVFPDVQPKINIYDVLTQYAEGLGVRPSVLNPNEEAEAATEQMNEMAQLQQTAGIAKDFGQAAGGLQGVDVGGGMTAVQAMLGG